MTGYYRNLQSLRKQLDRERMKYAESEPQEKLYKYLRREMSVKEECPNCRKELVKRREREGRKQGRKEGRKEGSNLKRKEKKKERKKEKKREKKEACKQGSKEAKKQVRKDGRKQGKP